MCPAGNDRSDDSFETLLQQEIEKAVWSLEAACLEPADAVIRIDQIRSILYAMRNGAAQAGYPVVMALCESGCRLIETTTSGPAQRRSLREHLDALRNIVIANLQSHRYDSLAYGTLPGDPQRRTA